MHNANLWIYRGVGSISLLLGTVGAFLPLLPTTVFILIAAWAFSKSSPRLYNRILQHKQFGKAIHNWQQYGAIPRKAKIAALISIALSTLISLVAMKGQPMWMILIAGVMCSVAVYILTRPSTPVEVSVSSPQP